MAKKDRALRTALINTLCAILMGIAALQLAIKPEAFMTPLTARGVTPDNWALNAMAIVTGIAFVGSPIIADCHCFRTIDH